MLKDLKVVFMGTPEFSVKILEALIENTSVLLVVCQPDRVVGRGKKIVYPKVKELAIEKNIPVFQPEKIKDDYDVILSYNPDIIITCAYGQIIPKILLETPIYKAINVHASLLPKLRGGAPIHHAIIDGYKETGITIMYMDSKMDSGDIISQRKTEINDQDTYQTLHDRLSILGRDLLLETLPSIITGTNSRIKQNELEVTFGYNIQREEELLNFNQSMVQVFNHIRGLNPDPGSYAILNFKQVKIYQGEKVADSNFSTVANGTIVKVDKTGIYVKVADGLIKILELQIEGKKRMLAANFLNGNKEDLVGLKFNEGVSNEK